MIDWLSLFTNAIWITALSAALAVVGYGFWLSRCTGECLAGVMSRSPTQELLLSAGFLFAVGRLLSVRIWWQKISWCLAVFLLLVLLLNAVYPGNDRD